MAISRYMLIPMKVIAPSITCWAVKAQVNKIWKTIDNVNGSAIGRFEMVLFDNQFGPKSLDSWIIRLGGK
ncbi:hypothetical protein AAZX31_13G063400 [Glycine max]|uniref:Uncharacterized protein n=2 Tax=Glycine subgen. Soja TaxID=1462606 RepID=K7LX54_SOYBN|nr:hypothetical protein GYH30_035488 [Glycine max]KRH18731.1 hypothetical protein GLYMA_13G079500v4 [Glycine max]RZB71389.1 hypothetical protein D0Y65_036046 [Glycine soja]